MIALVALSLAPPLDAPVDPGHDQARDWLQKELSNPQYAAAQPSWFDRLVSAFLHWLSTLKISGSGATQLPIIIIGALVIIAALVAAYLIFGAPRRGRRASGAGALFGDDDTRDSESLRRAAERAAENGDWATAIAEMFRSLARSLAERTIVSVLPGTTAHGFALKAAEPFPEQRERLRAVASDFDAVRYLGATGTENSYRDLAHLEKELRTMRPRLAEPQQVLQ